MQTKFKFFLRKCIPLDNFYIKNILEIFILSEINLFSKETIHYLYQFFLSAVKFNCILDCKFIKTTILNIKY